ncbi:MAG: hypothetical protein V4692_02260 [Bdellovibrionota bacterium]
MNIVLDFRLVSIFESLAASGVAKESLKASLKSLSDRFGFSGILNVMRLLVFTFIVILAGCATPETHRFGSEPTYEGTNSQADPASYGSDHFMVQKLMPIRAPAELNFYNKQCQETGQTSFVSRTSYFCNYR